MHNSLVYGWGVFEWIRAIVTCGRSVGDEHIKWKRFILKNAYLQYVDFVGFTDDNSFGRASHPTSRNNDKCFI